MSNLTAHLSWNPGARAIDETRDVIIPDVGYHVTISLSGDSDAGWTVQVQNVPPARVGRVLALLEDWEPFRVEIDY